MGPFFEDFAVGQFLQHGGRTITQADNTQITLLTNNMNPIHYDEVYASKTDFGRILVNSVLTLAIATGLSVEDLSRNGFNLGWENVRLPNPLYPGDTLICSSEILEARSSGSRPHMGLIKARTTGVNQDGVVVIVLERSILVYRRPEDDGS